MKTKILIVLLCSASLHLFAQVPLKTIQEYQYINSNYALGTGLLGLGDINGDGMPDFAVSAGNIGKTFIYFGRKGALDSLPDLIIKGGGAMAMGDLNGDGKMDLIMSRGDSIFIYFGKAPTPIAIDTISDVALAGGLSFAVGDINNDGYDDLVIGNQNHGLLQGIVYVYYGKPNFNGIPDVIVEGDIVNSGYGAYIKIADINGDGIKDLAISSDRRKYIDSTWVLDGTLDIYYGKIGWVFNKDSYHQRLDISKTGLSDIYWFNLLDINGDQKADISVTDSGKAYFFYGQGDSISYKPSYIIESDTGQYADVLGWPAVDIGDINNDGKRDFALRAGSGGAVCIYVYLGGAVPSKKRVAVRCKGFVEGSTAFYNVTPVGDINGDGQNDFATSVPFDALLGVSPQDGYFVIFSGDTTLITSIKPTEEKEYTFSLSQNYPNPFNPSTTIEYSLEKQNNIKISIYDITGKLVRVLFEGNQSAGCYRITWDGKNATNKTVSSGTYFLTAESKNNKEVLTKKIILVK